MNQTSKTLPKISIITASYNARAALEKTIRSVQDQNYVSLEHIIIDGSSRDGTLQMLQGLTYPNVNWLSEPDKGISDAFNKGIARATGEYLYFLGAGDTFVDSQVLTHIFSQLKSTPQLVCGKVLRVSEQGKDLWQSPKKWPKHFYPRMLLKKLSLPHQGLFMHRDYFTKYGVFSLQCRFAMDYELLLRAYHDFPSIQLVPNVVGRWRAGGVGTGRILEIYDEYHRIKKQHAVAPLWLLWGIDKWNRFKYRVKTLVVS